VAVRAPCPISGELCNRPCQFVPTFLPRTVKTPLPPFHGLPSQPPLFLPLGAGSQTMAGIWGRPSLIPTLGRRNLAEL
jgi:hypothetical protein